MKCRLCRSHRNTGYEQHSYAQDLLILPRMPTDQVSHLYLKLEEFICMNVMGACHSINSHEVYIIQLTTEATKWTTLEILVKKLWRVFVAFRQLKRFTSISLAESWALLLHRIRVAWSIAIKIGYVFLHHKKYY